MGSKKSSSPYFSPNFGLREPKVFGPLKVKETHIRFEFQDSNPKNGAWGEILKIALFDKRGIIQMNSSLRILRIGKFCKRNFVKR